MNHSYIPLYHSQREALLTLMPQIDNFEHVYATTHRCNTKISYSVTKNPFHLPLLYKLENSLYVTLLLNSFT